MIEDDYEECHFTSVGVAKCLLCKKFITCQLLIRNIYALMIKDY